MTLTGKFRAVVDKAFADGQDAIGVLRALADAFDAERPRSADDVRAQMAISTVDELEGYINSWFLVGTSTQTAWAVTGESYHEILVGKDLEYSALRGVLRAAADAFFVYVRSVNACTQTHRLYWRCRPEVDHYKDLTTGRQGWKLYMRLLLSDKAPRA